MALRASVKSIRGAFSVIRRGGKMKLILLAVAMFSPCAIAEDWRTVYMQHGISVIFRDYSRFESYCNTAVGGLASLQCSPVLMLHGCKSFPNRAKQLI